MVTFERGEVVVGLGTDHDDAALCFAVAQARQQACDVHLVHAMHPVLVVPPDIEEISVLEGSLRRAGSQLLARAARRVEQQLGGTATVSTELVHGGVVPSLVRASERAVLVVLQRTPRHGRVATLRVTNGVAARAHAPVAVVPAAWRPDPRRRDVIVAGVEDVAGSCATARAALGIARSTGGLARLVHAWWYSDMFDDLVFDGHAGTRHRAQLHEQLAAHLAPLLAEHTDVRTEILVVHAPPAEVLLQEAAEATLVVVGRHHPALAPGQHLGPVVRAVIDESACPVLVIEPTDDPPPERTVQ